MSKKQITCTLKFAAKDIFPRLTSAVLLDLNQKSATFNTSYTQPIGTTFRYVEHHFGQHTTYTAKICEYEKPYIFSYTLSNEHTDTKVSWVLDQMSEHETNISCTIILEKSALFHHFIQRSFSKSLLKNAQRYISYVEKVLKDSSHA